MKKLLSTRSALLSILAILLGAGDLSMAEDKKVRPRRTSAFSTVSPEFERTRLPNGEWEEVTYALGRGQMLDPTGRDDSLIELSFEELGQILAKALLLENFVPTPGPEETDLVIVVSWGKTIPASNPMGEVGMAGMAGIMNDMNQLTSQIAQNDAAGTSRTVEGIDPSRAELSSMQSELVSMTMMNQMAEEKRRRANYHNAKLLGYAPKMADLYSFDVAGGPQGGLLRDLEEEIESPRYFVILQAYDFKTMWKEKKRNMLWSTRFSIRAKGEKFDEQVGNMAQAAASMFGKKSNRLSRQLLPGRAKFGEIEMVEVIEDSEDAE